MNIENLLIPNGFITIAFCIYWFIAFPREVFSSMRMKGTITNKIVGVAIWSFICISFLTIAVLVGKLL